jgi:hypothetical protein
MLHGLDDDRALAHQVDAQADEEIRADDLPRDAASCASDIVGEDTLTDLLDDPMGLSGFALGTFKFRIIEPRGDRCHD